MNKKAIVLIDDDKTVLDSLRMQVEAGFGEQFICEPVQLVEEAWEVIDEFMTDGQGVSLIISDWMMGPDRGDEFLVAVHEKYPTIDLVMLSGYADEESIERAEKLANLKAFIRKPWEEEELLTTLNSILASA